MTDTAIHKRLGQRIEELPVLPCAVASLMTLDPEEEDYFDRVVEVVRTEPNFSARTLAMANSAASASHAPISTLQAAVSRIGSRGTANLVLALSVVRVFVPRDPWEASLWRHAVQVAVTARELARRAGDADVRADEAYTCGLLHDVGRFVMFEEGPEILRQVDEGDWDDPAGLIEMEKSICGLDHAELGELACRHWKLPDVVSQCVRNHHLRPSEVLEDGVEKLTALVRVADLAMFPSAIPGTRGIAEASDELLHERVHSQLPPFVRLSLGELRDLLREAAAEADEATEALGLR